MLLQLSRSERNPSGPSALRTAYDEAVLVAERRCPIASDLGCQVACPPGGCALARGLTTMEPADRGGCPVQLAVGPEGDPEDRRAQLVAATLRVFEVLTASELLGALELIAAVSDEDGTDAWDELMRRVEAGDERRERRRALGWPMPVG
jgi:hypothetical protein